METTSILDIAEDLIKAIDNNIIRLKDPNRPEDDSFITHRFIADELELLRDWVKSRTLEKREI